MIIEIHIADVGHDWALSGLHWGLHLNRGWHWRLHLDWSLGLSLGRGQGSVREGMREVGRVEKRALAVALDWDSVALAGDAVVGVGLPVLSADGSVRDISAEMSAEVLLHVPASSLVESTDVPALGLAAVGVRSSISAADWVDELWVAAAFVGLVVSETLALVVNGDTLAS